MASILALSRAEQERSKKLMSRRLYAHGVTLALGIAALWLSEPYTYGAAVGALVSEALAWSFRRAAQEGHVRAEEGRRRALVAREMGADVGSLVTAELLAQFSSKSRQIAPQWEDDDYYSTKGRPAPERFQAALQESAFWSSRLYEIAARRGYIRLGALTAVLIMLLLVLGAAGGGDFLVVAARVATVFFVTLIGIDEIGQVSGFQDAARVSRRTVQELERIDPRRHEQMLNVFADYAVATATAAPIPTKIYKQHHDVIEDAWKIRQSS
ncbi:hypothetical protein [Kocuria rosea]|uniref:hypothetical protein n=1 Tax=Kocuria rosea TaxID=1275 RepID=UPI002330A94A|nr:hypothetical protein [Kocuria rosea]